MQVLINLRHLDLMRKLLDIVALVLLDDVHEEWDPRSDSLEVMELLLDALVLIAALQEALDDIGIDLVLVAELQLGTRLVAAVVDEPNRGCCSCPCAKCFQVGDVDADEAASVGFVVLGKGLQ